MYCSTTAIQESVAFSSDTVTGLRLQHPQLAAVGSATVVAVAPTEGKPWHFVKLGLFARGSPTRGAVERSETERLYFAAAFVQERKKPPASLRGALKSLMLFYQTG